MKNKCVIKMNAPIYFGKNFIVIYIAFFIFFVTAPVNFSIGMSASLNCNRTQIKSIDEKTSTYASNSSYNIKVNGDDIHINISKWNPIIGISSNDFWIQITNVTRNKKLEGVRKTIEQRKNANSSTYYNNTGTTTLGVTHSHADIEITEKEWIVLKKDLDIIQKKFLEWINIAKTNHITSLQKPFPIPELSLQSSLLRNASMAFELKDSKAILDGWTLTFNENSIPIFKKKIDEFLRLEKQNEKNLELFK